MNLLARAWLLRGNLATSCKDSGISIGF